MASESCYFLNKLHHIKTVNVNYELEKFDGINYFGTESVYSLYDMSI